MNKDEIKTLMTRSVKYGDRQLLIGEMTLFGAYFGIHMGFKQMHNDTFAAWPAFVGYTDKGSVPKNAMKPEKRIALAKTHFDGSVTIDGVSMPYDDTKNAHRELLAEYHFAKLIDNKLSKVMSGETLPVDTGVRMTPDEKALTAMADEGARAYAVERKLSIAQLCENTVSAWKCEPDDAWDVFVAYYLQVNRAEYETELAAAKAKAVSRAKAAAAMDMFAKPATA